MHDREQKLTDAVALGLQALAWAVADPVRARRMLAVTGLEPADLRARAADPALLAAILAFVEAYQPDLLACAAALDVPPIALVAAREALEG